MLSNVESAGVEVCDIAELTCRGRTTLACVVHSNCHVNSDTTADKRRIMVNQQMIVQESFVGVATA